jgi:hypothetical protein
LHPEFYSLAGDNGNPTEFGIPALKSPKQVFKVFLETDLE